MPISTPPIDLSQLKDIHTSAPTSFWPLAKGWYILIITFFILGLILFYLWKRHKRKPLPYALKELEKIKNLPPKNQMKLLAQLLKRVAMVKYERPQIAPLSEERWQDFLIAAAPDTLTKTQAHDLAFAIYDKKIPDIQLYRNCQKWIKFVLKKH